MPVTASWDTDEKIAIRLDICAPWTWDELWKTVEDVHMKIEEVDYRVPIILANAEAAVTSAQPGVLNHLGALNRRRHPRSGPNIVVQPESARTSAFWFRMLNTIYPRVMECYRFTETIEQARHLADERYQQQMQQRVS